MKMNTLLASSALALLLGTAVAATPASAETLVTMNTVQILSLIHI